MDTNVHGGTLNRVASPSGVTDDPTTQRALYDLARNADRNRIIADGSKSLHRILQAVNVRTVQLRAGMEYRLAADLVLTQAVEIVGPRSARIVPWKGLTPRIYVPATCTGRVTIRGVTLMVPVEIEATTDLVDCEIGGAASVLTGGAQVEIVGAGASGSSVVGCVGSAAETLGVYEHGGAMDCRILGNDFRACATGFKVTIADTAHLGPDSNAGVVVLV